MHRSGPLFDGRAEIIIREADQQVSKEIAEFAEDQVKSRLGMVLRHPTGYYESQIRAHRVGSYWHVDDSGVAYGPWLESGKNRRRTRFKGYFAFRRAAQIVDRRAGEIAERVFQRYIRRLG